MSNANPPDRGLQVRLAAVAVLVVVANAVFVAVALELLTFVPGWAIRVLQLPEAVARVGPADPEQVSAAGRTLRGLAPWRSPLVVPLTLLFLLQYEGVARRPLQPAASAPRSDPPPTLEARVRRLAQQAGVRPPSVAVVDANPPNCYTVGRTGAATIVVSESLVDTLDDAELDVVLAHELAHVQNRDVTVMTVALAPFHLARSVATALDRTVYRICVALYALVMLGVVVVTGGLLVVLGVQTAVGLYDRAAAAVPLVSPGPLVPGGPVASARGLNLWVVSFADTVSRIGAYPLLVALLLSVPLAVLGAYYLILGFVPRWLSAYREFAADRGAAQLTGDPASLASALESLSDARPAQDYRRAASLQGLSLLPDGFEAAECGPIATYLAAERPVVRTTLERIPVGVVAHPDTDVRVRRLRSMVAASARQ
jgi:heat shock protein HtpX